MLKPSIISALVLTFFSLNSWAQNDTTSTQSTKSDTGLTTFPFTLAQFKGCEFRNPMGHERMEKGIQKK